MQRFLIKMKSHGIINLDMIIIFQYFYCVYLVLFVADTETDLDRVTVEDLESERVIEFVMDAVIVLGREVALELGDLEYVGEREYETVGVIDLVNGNVVGIADLETVIEPLLVTKLEGLTVV